MNMLRDYQEKAVQNLSTGCILAGGTGVGKSRTALAYYFREQGGEFGEKLAPIPGEYQRLYIITTAKKRDCKEWEIETTPFRFSDQNDPMDYMVVDSWNNVGKYINVKDSFFIFDEQRATGSGPWAKAFIKIARNNDWIMLSATPGDKWIEYVNVFVANGFYKSRTDFINQHVYYNQYSKYPNDIAGYLNVEILKYYRSLILVPMECEKHTVAHKNYIEVSYDMRAYKLAGKTRWNPYQDKPIQTGSEMAQVYRRISNTSIDRAGIVLDLAQKHKKVIIFYNFDYELMMLRKLFAGSGFKVAEWNGHKHEEVPERNKKWAYLVQYSAGAEGWNCTSTDTIIFYSQSYSYKQTEQAAGRIDRMNTPFTDLYYYHLVSKSPIDRAIKRALMNKKEFNESAFIRGRYNPNAFQNVLRRSG